jgi:hypothetical protein
MGFKIKATSKEEITCNEELVIKKDEEVYIVNIKTVSDETWVTVKFKRLGKAIFYGMTNINRFNINI